MNANDLLLITIEHQTKLEDVLKECENDAKMGRCEHVLFGYISTELMVGLAQLGLRIQKKETVIGETIYIISWA